MPEIPKHAKFLAETKSDGKKSDEVLAQNPEELKKQALKVYVEKYYKTKKQAQELKQKDPKKATEILKTAGQILDDIKELKETSAISDIKKISEKYKLKDVMLVDKETSEKVKDFENFYKEVFGMEVDLSEVEIPEKKEGFDRLIILVPGMTPQKLYDKCAEQFSCNKWTKTDLDKIVKSERTSETNAYAVWFRDRVEADDELKDKSADELEAEGILGITLEERLIYELKYFKETGNHLDISNITLCSGSRYSDGDVPRVRWRGGRLEVYGSHPVNRSDGVRTRAAVILES